MIILDATTKKLQVVLDGAAATTELPVMASFAEMTTTTYLPVESDTITTGATAVDVVAAPAASTQRQVKLLTIPNVDTAVRTVTVRYNNNGTIRKLFVATLAVGDCLVYTDGEGFRVLDASGAVKSYAQRTTNDRQRQIGFVVDAGVSVISTGFKSNVRMPYAGTIQSATLLSKNGATGAIVIDVKKSTYAGFGSPSSICASAKPTITATAAKSEDATLTGWTTHFDAGDVLGINVDSVATFTWIMLSLKILTD